VHSSVIMAHSYQKCPIDKEGKDSPIENFLIPITDKATLLIRPDFISTEIVQHY